jgi:hypothetical protein
VAMSAYARAKIASASPPVAVTTPTSGPAMRPA